MAYHNGQRFSTKDRDHDRWSANCAISYEGAWWYNSCLHSNLNGLYIPGLKAHRVMYWWKWKRNEESLKRVEMKMRPSG